MAGKKKGELVPLMTRLPEQLLVQLRRAAASEERSLNSEIIFRLRASVDRDDSAKDYLSRLEKLCSDLKFSVGIINSQSDLQKQQADRLFGQLNHIQEMLKGKRSIS